MDVKEPADLIKKRINSVLESLYSYGLNNKTIEKEAGLSKNYLGQQDVKGGNNKLLKRLEMLLRICSLQKENEDLQKAINGQERHPQTIEELKPLEGIGADQALVQALVHYLSELEAFVYKQRSPEDHRDKIINMAKQLLKSEKT